MKSRLQAVRETELKQLLDVSWYKVPLCAKAGQLAPLVAFQGASCPNSAEQIKVMKSWLRNDYLKIATAHGLDNETALRAWTNANGVQRKGLPAILSLNHLAVLTDVPYAELRSIVGRNYDPYRVFRISKRAGTGYRTIAVPHEYLRRVQSWIDKQILSKVDPHERAMAFKPGASIVKCASEHAGCKWLIKCDVAQFFESLSEIKVYRFFHSLGYLPLVSFEIARLLTRVVRSSKRYSRPCWQNNVSRYGVIHSYFSSRIGHLAQGAPTSPKLSNLITQELDERLEEFAAGQSLTYTRYADDIILSSHDIAFDRLHASGLVGQIYREFRRIGLRPNTVKTEVVSPGARKIVLGLCVNDVRPRLTKEFRNLVSTHVHFIVKFGLVKHSRIRGFDSPIGCRNHVNGLLQHSAQVEPEFANKMFEKLGDNWKELS